MRKERRLEADTRFEDCQLGRPTGYGKSKYPFGCAVNRFVSRNVHFPVCQVLITRYAVLRMSFNTSQSLISSIFSAWHIDPHVWNVAGLWSAGIVYSMSLTNSG